MITRSEWGARSPKSRSPLKKLTGGAIIHHTAASNRGLTHWPDCWNRWRRHQDFHMDSRGWSDIAYNFLVCAHGFVFEGRGWNTRNGANFPVNGSTYSIAWEGTVGNRVDPAVITAINGLLNEGLGRGWAARVRGHKQVRLMPTACPGELQPLIWTEIRPGTPTTPPPEPPPDVKTPILGEAQVKLEAGLQWARQGAPDLACVAPIYWVIGPELGVRPEVALAQAAKETNWGRFTGVVPRSHNNWCGLKTQQGGGNNDPNAHAQFPSDEVGVRAHLEHLKLYAEGPVQQPVDPRHFPSIAGTAPNVEDLGGPSKWAPNPDYGESIVNNYLSSMLNLD